MRFLLAFAVIAASLSQAATANDGLFSEVAMEAVFEKKTKTTAETAEISATDTLVRITGTDSLLGALKSAGLEANEDGEKVSIQLRQGRWNLPLSMVVRVDQDRILNSVSLAKLEKVPASSEQLLKLLTAGDATDNMFFAYNDQSKFIVLRSSLSNRSVTPNQLRKHLQDLATMAENHADSWSALGKTAKTGPKTAPKTAQNTTQNTTQKATAKPTFSMLGSWTAALGKDAFAIKLTSDSKFQLVHIKNGKSTVSKGKVSRSGNSMTLAGDDGNTLRFTVAQTAANQFQLAITGANGKTGTKLNFKKAK